METPLYLPEQRAIVFADALTAPGGVLRVWSTPFLETRTLPALRALLELPFDHVLVSHGEPVHRRADFEAALEREPWAAVERPSNIRPKCGRFTPRMVWCMAWRRRRSI